MIRRACCVMVLFTACSAGFAQDMPLYKDILIDGEGWKLFFKDCKSVGGLAVDVHGNLYISNVTDHDGFVVAADGKATNSSLLKDACGLAYRGKLHICCPKYKIIVTDMGTDMGRHLVGERKIGLAIHEIVVPGPENSYSCYVTVPSEGAVYFDKGLEGTKQVVHNLKDPVGLALWPDEGTLVVSDAKGEHLWTYRIEKDGSLAHREGYYTLRKQSGTGAIDAAGMTVDEKGRLYVCTAAGLQVFDPTGRLCGVILKPKDAKLTHVALGGPKGDTLFVACGDEIYARKIKAKGVPWSEKSKKP